MYVGLGLAADPELWTGTGGAVVGAALNGLVAIGAAFLAAHLARRHDRQAQARQACGRLAQSVRDAMDEVLSYSDSRYSVRLVDAVKAVHMQHLGEMAYFTEPKLSEEVHRVVTWLSDVWIPAAQRAYANIPIGTDPETGLEASDLRAVRALAKQAGDVLSALGAALTTWQLRGDLPSVVDLPPLETAQDDAA